MIRFLKLFLIIVYHKGSLKYSRISELLIYWQRRVQTFKRTGSTFEINQEQNPKYNFTLLLKKKKVSKVLVCVMFYMKGHVYEKIFFSLGLSRICFFLPDAGYPAGLSDIPCRIMPDIRLFFAGYLYPAQPYISLKIELFPRRGKPSMGLLRENRDLYPWRAV